MVKKIKLNNHAITVTHEEKILFPATKITKANLIEYYLEVANTMLPYIQNHPLTLQRFPNSITDPGFFHKNASNFFPTWLKIVTLPKQEGTVKYIIPTAASDLIYFVNLNTIAFHVGLSSIQNIFSPDLLIFDLDPYEIDFSMVKLVAQKIKEITDSFELNLLVKTTGSKGLHLHLPLHPDLNFEQVREFAKKLASTVTTSYPNIASINPKKDKREGRVFVDYIRNSYGHTVVAPYSVRAKEGAPVAAPITWEELSSSITSADCFNIASLPARLSKLGDLWAGVEKNFLSAKILAKL